VLIDAVSNGAKRKMLAWANRNGFYYLLDRATGEFLLGTPYVKQTWSDGFDAKGRPHVRPESVPSREGALVYPNLYGGTNWWSPTYDAELGLLYIPTTDRGGIFYVSPEQPVSAEGFLLGGIHRRVPNEDTIVAVKALEVLTGRVRWQYSRNASPERDPLNELGGLLSTSGHLVFGGDGEAFFAWDAGTGAELWRFETGGNIAAAPISYEQDGRQYVAVAAGRSILVFALPASNSRNHLQPQVR
jgi:alcohol dehydrogenase (cytochrome c)